MRFLLPLVKSVLTYVSWKTERVILQNNSLYIYAYRSICLIFFVLVLATLEH